MLLRSKRILFTWMVPEFQPTKSVVRLVIERNIVAMSPDRTPQSRTQRENLYMRSGETTRPSRGVALFGDNCDLTDADAQEDTVLACRSANPRIIIVGVLLDMLEEPPRILHDNVYVRGALFIMILTDSNETPSEEQFLALETLHQSEGSAWLGRDL